MWSLKILEDYTQQIKAAGERTDLSDHDRYNRIFEIVREIHTKSRMLGVEECKHLIVRTIENI